MESLDGTPMGRYGYGSVLFLIVFTFVIGLIFAPFSFGFIFFLVFWIVWAILYSLLIQFKYPIWRLLTVVGIFFTGLLGFIIGRLLVGDKHPFKCTYDD